MVFFLSLITTVMAQEQVLKTPERGCAWNDDATSYIWPLCYAQLQHHCKLSSESLQQVVGRGEASHFMC